MKQSSYGPDKDKILKRLTRAEGQIRGISRMIAEDIYCIDVLTQISAAQAALDKTALELLRGHARTCMHTETPADAHDKQADELVKAVSRLLAR